MFRFLRLTLEHGRRKKRWGLYALGALVVGTGLVLPRLATEGSPVPPADTAGGFDGPDAGALLLRLVLGTAFVLGLAVAILWLCRHLLRGRFGAVPGAGQLELLESLPLGCRCRVHLVRAGSLHLLAGVDGAGLKALVALAGPAEEPESDSRVRLSEGLAAVVSG